ncbi:MULTISPECIES: iron ABC transporter permease [unclassified Listeria]|uniref:FecCD family ABC transporter permease n=1 Tax=unclassified Listeria TaxID=2642072 RepID=UPI000B589B80|nr:MULTISPECIES: iron ABC transporter permease [unclassified Listeria]
MKKSRFIIIFCTGLILLILTALFNLTVGTEALPFSRVLAVLTGQGEMLENFVLFDLRLPRLLIVLFGGMALVLSGSLLQTLMKNDLADPGIIGVNSGAGVGVAIFFLFMPFGAASINLMLPLAGVIGGLVTALLIIVLSRNNPQYLILNGIGFSFAMSGLMVVLMSSANREKVDFLAKWLSGSIWGVDWPYVWLMLAMLVLFVPLLFLYSHKLDLLTLDENTIINLGLRAGIWRILFIGIAVVFAAVTVSITGAITFLGLIGPHIAKSLVGPKHRFFMPVAMLIGAELFLIADTIAKPFDLPAGIIVSIIGSPYFIYLLFKK